MGRAEQISVGDPERRRSDSPGPCMGPLVSGPQRDKVLGFISKVGARSCKSLRVCELSKPCTGAEFGSVGASCSSSRSPELIRLVEVGLSSRGEHRLRWTLLSIRLVC